MTVKEKKEIKKQILETGIKNIPGVSSLISIVLSLIFSNRIPFIECMDDSWKSLLTTSLSLVLGVVIFAILKLSSKHIKKNQINKHLQAKLLKGERIIDSEKSIIDLKNELTEIKKKIKLESNRQQNLEQILIAYSKFEKNVELLKSENKEN